MAVDGTGVPFQEAIDFLKQKVNLPTRTSSDLRHGAHVRAFSVAGVVRDDMLTDFLAAIIKAREDGTDLNEFRKTFDEIVDRTGWSFYGRGTTEGERRAWRARVIFETNMRTSYHAGRYRQMTSPAVLKARPYWRYRHNDVRFPRPMHLKWDGTVLRATDPWWDTHFTPNGWGCQCEIETLSERDLKRLGKAGPDEAPPDDVYTEIDRRTGETITRHPGIDKGWEYNPGKEWLHGVVPPELAEPLPPPGMPATPLTLPPLPAPRKVGATELMPAGLPDTEYVDAFLSEFGASRAQPVAFRDPSGGVITISDHLFEQRNAAGEVFGYKVTKRGREVYTRLLAEAIADPDEIWVDWFEARSGYVLRRAYIKRMELPDGRALFVRFEWTKLGWVSITGFDSEPGYVEKFRSGALLYRRQ